MSESQLRMLGLILELIGVGLLVWGLYLPFVPLTVAGIILIVAGIICSSVLAEK